jgi:hypothetical protein
LESDLNYELRPYQRELIAFDGKMEEFGDGKVIPPDDVLRDEFGERVHQRTQKAVALAIDQRRDSRIATIEAAKAAAAQLQRGEMARVTAPLHALLAALEAPFLGKRPVCTVW